MELEELVKTALKNKLAEIEKKREESKARIVESMKGHTLQENMKRIGGSLALMGAKESLKMMVSKDMDPGYRKYTAGYLASIKTVVEMLEAALDNSSDIKTES